MHHASSSAEKLKTKNWSQPKFRTSMIHQKTQWKGKTKQNQSKEVMISEIIINWKKANFCRGEIEKELTG